MDEKGKRQGNPRRPPASFFLPEDQAILPLTQWCQALHLKCPSPLFSLNAVCAGVVYQDQNIIVTAHPTRHLVSHTGQGPISFAYQVQGEGKNLLFTGDLTPDFSDFPQIAWSSPSISSFAKRLTILPRRLFQRWSEPEPKRWFSTTSTIPGMARERHGCWTTIGRWTIPAGSLMTVTHLSCEEESDGMTSANRTAKVALLCDLHLPLLENTAPYATLRWAVNQMIEQRANFCFTLGDITAHGAVSALLPAL